MPTSTQLRLRCMSGETTIDSIWRCQMLAWVAALLSHNCQQSANLGQLLNPNLQGTSAVECAVEQQNLVSWQILECPQAMFPIICRMTGSNIGIRVIRMPRWGCCLP
mmetsp:Transcript_32576/g.92368  ORF Transcript_32576/g.92368 Transcript_32576/m.92368 type:complete len:107 (+) Transcript_32576:681-1001(+)